MGGDIMTFPDTVEEFMEQYKMVDREQIYSNGCEYVPIFRMNQWFAHKPQIDLVRCGECVHHDEDGWGYGNCQRPSVDYLRTADDDFCSYGERREDGDI